MSDPNAGASGVEVGGGDQGATLEGETTGPGGDTSPAVTDDSVDADVTPEPERQNVAVVDDPSLSPEVASAAAAEIEAAELGDAATASRQYQGGDAAPDPQ